MNKTKPCEVVMVPSTYPLKEGQILKLIKNISNLENIKLYDLIVNPFDSDEPTDRDFWEPFHLYVISEDNIKNGEWMYSKTFNKVFKASYNTTNTDDYKKILATSDESLGLPLIPKEWIEKEYLKFKTSHIELEMELLWVWEMREDNHGEQPEFYWNNIVIANNPGKTCTPFFNSVIKDLKHNKEEDILRVGADNTCPVTHLHCDDECCTPGSECNLSGSDVQDHILMTDGGRDNVEFAVPTSSFQVDNSMLTKEEFAYQLKHVISPDKRKEWADANKNRIISNTELDDAAIKFYLTDTFPKEEIPIVRAFKAGAEWQGKRL